MTVHHRIDEESQPVSDDQTITPRRRMILKAARTSGLLGEKDGRIAGRIPKALVKAAKERSGIQSDSELIEYALATVAMEDDFGRKLLAREGSIPQDIDLEF